MENQYSEKLCEDIVRISNILPNLSVEAIRSELSRVADTDDGVVAVLRKHLLAFDVGQENALSDDIKKIKRVVPGYTIVNITQDLSKAERGPYRVQTVLKKYFQSENVPVKRLFTELQTCPGMGAEKKLKVADSPANQTVFYDALDELMPLSQAAAVDLSRVKVEQEPATSTGAEQPDSQTEQSTQSTQDYTIDDLMQLLLEPKQESAPAAAHALADQAQALDYRTGLPAAQQEAAGPADTSANSEPPRPGPSTTATYTVFPVAVPSTSTAALDDDVFITSVNLGKPPPTIDLTATPACEAEEPGAEHEFFFKLMAMFPDIDPACLRCLCAGKPSTGAQFDALVNLLLKGDYERRVRDQSPVAALDFDEQLKLLLDLFPNADPSYLQNHCERLIDEPDRFSQFVATLLETRAYPSKTDYLKKMKLSAQEKQYTTEFDVEKFLDVIPNPEQYFNDPKRTLSYTEPNSKYYALTFLKNHYGRLHVREITQVFSSHKSVLKAAQVLDAMRPTMRAKRKLYPLTSCQNIPLLQEIAYVTHGQVIRQFLREQEETKEQLRQQAKQMGLMKTCGCCYDDEVMPEDAAYCEAAHLFCKQCVRQGCEVVIGQGKLHFGCLEACESHFSLQVLQSVLSPKVFSKMAQRKQLEEIKAAGIEELEFCPFCDFATIPAPGDKLFRCLNDECMKESCRQCHEPSHIPLRCDEVEKEEEVKTRTYIEDKMTEALVRKCYKCSMKFVKEDGCNKMTCSCGAMMCYVCNQPVQDYAHFNGQGGTQYHLCPLFSDTEKLHMKAVKRGAQAAKAELGVGTEKQLKHDPTDNLDEHYKKLLKAKNALNHHQ